jgi:hypothetical protein
MAAGDIGQHSVRPRDYGPGLQPAADMGAGTRDRSGVTRLRHLTQALPPAYAARLFEAQEQGATEQQLRDIAAEGLRESYCHTSSATRRKLRPRIAATALLGYPRARSASSTVSRPSGGMKLIGPQRV